MAKAKKLKRYMVTASVVGSKFIGYFEAESADAAIEQAGKSGRCGVSLCHECSSEISDPEIDELFAEEVGNDEC